MEKELTFKIYRLELATGKIGETNKEYTSTVDAKEECDFLNRMTATMKNVENIKYFYFYSFYSDFKAFNSQEDLRDLALKKLERWNDDINKLKALYMVATKSLLQGGLNKKEAV